MEEVIQKKENVVERLRTKPVGVRKLVQIVVALSLTVIVGAIALGTALVGSPEKRSQQQGKNDAASPFSILRESFSGIFDTTKNEINSLTTSTDSKSK